MAVSDALFEARHFVLGCPNLIVAVDHKPLLGILNDKSVADIDNPRLLMLMSQGKFIMDPTACLGRGNMISSIIKK